MNFGQHYTVKEVAKLMGCSDEHVVGLYEDGDLKGINIARKGAKHRELRFAEEALDEFAAGRTKSPSQPLRKIIRTSKVSGSENAPQDYSAWYRGKEVPHGR